MILYLDSSALVKRYVVEPGTAEVLEAIDNADFVGTSIISRAETVAALAKAVRVGALEEAAAFSTAQRIRSEWFSFVRVQVTETLIARADTLAWELGLRGYDSVQLASALLWQEGMDGEVTMATFDQRLWEASILRGLTPFPEDVSNYLMGG